MNDIRWKQRFENYEKAVGQLEEGIRFFEKDPQDIVKEGVIQRFEFSHELAWKLMRDFLTYEGIVGIIGSRTATREAFNKGIITNGQGWMDMLESRNLTVHTYNKDILTDEFEKIVQIYFPLMKEFLVKMKTFL